MLSGANGIDDDDVWEEADEGNLCSIDENDDSD